MNGGGNTLANTGTYWSFTTGFPPLGRLQQDQPGECGHWHSNEIRRSPGGPARAISYEYCYATTTGCTSWTSVGTNTQSPSPDWRTTRSTTGRCAPSIPAATPWPTAVPTGRSPRSCCSGRLRQDQPGERRHRHSRPQLSPGLHDTGRPGFEYCYATTTGCTNWTSAGTNTSVAERPSERAAVLLAGPRPRRRRQHPGRQRHVLVLHHGRDRPWRLRQDQPGECGDRRGDQSDPSWAPAARPFPTNTATPPPPAARAGLPWAPPSVALSGLANDTTYYWQVRAVNGGGNTLADAGTYWSFTTVVAACRFPKTSPANAATGVANAERYPGAPARRDILIEYCYATTTGCTSWTSARHDHLAQPCPDLSNNQVYYWQVRAINASGDTLADAGTYWSFTTVVAGLGLRQDQPGQRCDWRVTEPNLYLGHEQRRGFVRVLLRHNHRLRRWTSVGRCTTVALSGTEQQHHLLLAGARRQSRRQHPG